MTTKPTWRFRGPNGEFVGMVGFKCSFVPESQATLFSDLDNRELKQAFWQVFLGPLTVEELQ